MTITFLIGLIILAYILAYIITAKMSRARISAAEREQIRRWERHEKA
jgi:hypothetical protein